MSKFTVVARDMLTDGPGVQVAHLKILGPDGKIFGRQVVHRPNAVAICAKAVNGTILMNKQYRSPLDTELYEIPAGKVDPGETPQQAAIRELEEETGYKSAVMKHVLSYYPSPGYSDELLHIFFADELWPVGKRLEGEEEQAMELHHISPKDLPGMMKNGHLVDGKTIMALMLAGYVL